MKKIMMTVLACAMLAACGGKTVEEQAIDYNEQMLEAMEAGDLKKMEAIEEEGEKWFEALSEADQEKAEKALEEWQTKNEKRLEKAFENLY